MKSFFVYVLSIIFALVAATPQMKIAPASALG